MSQPKLNNLKLDVTFSGAVKCLRNAQELCDEAEILHQHNKYARSFALSHFAREEFSKSCMLFRALLEVAVGNRVDWRTLNRNFRSHEQKWLDDLTITSKMLSPLLEEIDSPIPWDEVLGYKGACFKNEQKNSCLYTDWDNGNFTLPSEIITEKQSERNLSIAIYRIATIGPRLMKSEILKNIPKVELKKHFPVSPPKNLEEYLAVIAKISSSVVA